MSLAYLSIISLSIIHIASGVRSLFLFGAEYSVVYIYHILSVHLYFIITFYLFNCSSVHRHLSCLHLLSVVYNAAMNVGVQVFKSVFIPFGYMPTSECWIVVSLCLTFWESVQQLFQGSSFYMSSPTVVIFPFKKVYNSHPRGYEVILVISFLKSPITDSVFLIF